jgi:dTDP-4-dehydrorhamnose reductase
MTIAITGAEGQLGSALCRQLGADAVGLDLPAFDLTDGRCVADTLERLRPRAVINTAAYTLVDRAEEEIERCRAINVDGVALLAEVCARLDCTLVQISTDYVFGRDATRREPYRETDEPGPLGVYGQAKCDAERAAARCPQHLIVRTCGLYGRLGPRSPGNFVETMLRLAAAHKPLRVVDDQHGTPSYVPHVARAILFLLTAGTCGIYHVVNRGATTWYRLAVELFGQAGIEASVAPITAAQYGAPAPRPAYGVLDTAKYHALAGAPAMPTWQEALAEYLATRNAAQG